jgi:hypothetical protein
MASRNFSRTALSSDIDIVLTVKHVENTDAFRSGSQRFDRSLPEIRYNEALISTFQGLQEYDATGIQQPAPLSDDRPFLARGQSDTPDRRRHLTLVGFVQEILNVPASIEAQRILGAVQVQTPTLRIDSEVVAVRRELDCLRLSGVWIAKVCDCDFICDCELFSCFLSMAA